MAYDEYLGERIQRIMDNRHANCYTKKMIGGLVFMVDDKMCVGAMREKDTGQDRMMVRLDPELSEEYLSKDGCDPMDFTGKRMKGFFHISGAPLESDESLDYWIGEAIAFNPKAKSSKKK